MIFRRARFGDVIAPQLDLFVEDEAELLREVASEAERSTTRAERDEAEELYGDYVDSCRGRHRGPRRHARHVRATLDEDTREDTSTAFNRAVAKRCRCPLSRSRTGDGAIEDYALIGDLQTAALVGRDGSIDWLCFPRFDSGACFAALLGERGERPLAARAGRRGRATSSAATATTRSCSRPTWQTEHGRVRVIDFMPPRGDAPDVVRIVEGVEGSVRDADRSS